DLELRFAGAPRADAATPLSREVRPVSRQPRQEVLELGELDLQLPFDALRALREDVEDELAPVDHANRRLASRRRVEAALEVSLLGGAQRIVEDDQVRVGLAH